MNVDTGKLYPSLPEALDAGEDPQNLVEIVGTREQVERLSEAVKKAKKAKRKQAQKSRRRNR